MKPLLCIVGPTGSGKTAVGVAVAKSLSAEIISIDSRQLYRGFRIGAAQPTEAECAGIPHHLIDFQDANKPMTAGQFAKLSHAKILQLVSAGKNVILVGGSGLYFRAIFDGLFQGPLIEEAYRVVLRERARIEGVPALHDELQRIDPALAQNIMANDYPRIERGLEVYHASGKTMSQWWKEQEREFEFSPIYVGLSRDRADVVNRIAKRTKEMLATGWIEEVQTLLAAGYDEAIDREKFHGYRELAAYLRGEIMLAEAEERINIVTRQYAKRQMTWFRHTKNVTWVDVKPDETTLETAQKILTTWQDSIA
ncbi:MAG: tRNA (adenosine(37)-N6)-dimethylallyltransferase MiaA [bacterium]|nr:tRNA (adenosine(37)-N6)-dimethylallyltransferase MiaA [bacterium]